MKMITIRLDDEKHQQLKEAASREGKSLNRYCLERLAWKKCPGCGADVKVDHPEDYCVLCREKGYCGVRP